MINKTLGSIFVAAGTAIGASMLALPMVSAGMGLFWAFVAFFVVWPAMWVSGLLTLEVNLAFKAPNNHYGTMAQATLGKPGQYFTMVAYLLLLYALISAYISGGASVLEASSILLFNAKLHPWANAVIFTGILGLIVAWSTRALDYANRGLFIGKLIILILVFGLLFPEMNSNQLFAQQDVNYLWGAFPVIVTAFGFHIVIPSLSSYLNKDVKALKKVLLFGSLLPLVIYLLWLGALFGIPDLDKNQSSVNELILAINATQKSVLLTPAINLFAQLALITSFLGVSLGLFDFLRDKKDKQPHRARTALLTFIPPLCVVIFYPNAFIQLLSYASIFVAIILIILPAVMAYRMRGMPELQSTYRTPGGNWTIVFAILIGLFFIAVECARIAGMLPVWAGN